MAKEPRKVDGLRGWDQQQGDLRDTQGGTYGMTPRHVAPTNHVQAHQSAHEGAQPGADVKPDALLVEDGLPAGLKQERKGPLNPSSGRAHPKP
jgi:hypothetical protein